MTNGSSTEQTRARLLNAAAGEILAHGYAGASMARIAERIGLTKGAFSHHFPTKDTLIVAAVDHVAQLAPRLAAEAVTIFPRSPIRAAVATMGGIAAVSTVDPVLGAALRMFQDPSVPADTLVPLQQTMVDLFEPFFRGAVEREHYTLVMTTDDAARYLVVVLMGFLSARRFPSMFQLHHEQLFVQTALAGIGIPDADAVVAEVLAHLLPR